MSGGIAYVLDDGNFERMVNRKLVAIYPLDALDLVMLHKHLTNHVKYTGSKIAQRTLGLSAGRTTQGHRFEARIASIELKDADHYADQLRDEGAVIASFAERRAEIVRQLAAAASAEGLTPIDDDALLDEVTALVERPQVMLCRFEEAFLAVPPECLILTMKANQKYFPLLDGEGRLTHKFLIVSNIRPADPSAVIGGNERVVRPRLADAKFFFDQDRKRTLESRVDGLAKVVYHGKLGTQGERTERVRRIAREIGERLGGAALAATADRAAQLAKADLLTDMVGEFPELQGVMGGYYARHDGETEAVAFAVEDHYKPRFAGDALPRDEAGVVVALADKMETLAGLFGIGQVPTGDKDPFALRRHALGVIRMLVERALPLSVPELVATAFHAFPAGHGQAQAEVAHFMYERLIGYLRELGYSAQEVDAVVALQARRPGPTSRKRLAAVRAFAALPRGRAAGGGQQARGQHPAQVRRGARHWRRRTQLLDRAGRAGAGRARWRRPQAPPTAPLRMATTPRRCSRWRCSRRRSTLSSTR